MSFFDELKRRNVVRVAIAYAVAAWVLLQVSDLVLTNIEAPSWVIKSMMLVVLIGFIAAVVIAWAFELTPEGIRKEKDVDRTKSITGDTARKLDRIIIGFLVLALAYFVYERQTMQPMAGPAVRQIAEAPVTVQAQQAEPSIAVLPFADMSPDKDQEHFSDGISEELLNLLVRVNGLKVASRTSAFSYKNTSLNLAEIADELKVDHILEGSIRKADNRVRITAQLIDAATDRHLWSDTYDRELNDIFAIQNEISNAIVNALREELGMLQNASEITVSADTENLDAYELYLEGRALFIARDKLDESIRLLERAVELDPKFARAWESLGAVYAIATDWLDFDDDFESKALLAANKALQLNPDLSMPWATLGADEEISPLQALEYYDKAIQNDPKNTTALLWRSFSWNVLGYTDNAIADAQSCLDIDPLYENCRRHLAGYLLSTGSTELALDLYRISAERGFFGSTYEFAFELFARGRRLAAISNMWVDIGDRSFPMDLVADAIEHPDHDNSKTVAAILAWIESRNGEAANWHNILALAGNYERVPADQYVTYWVWLPRHKAFRQTERFKQILREIGATDYWREFGYPPRCRPLGEEDFECD